MNPTSQHDRALRVYLKAYVKYRLRHPEGMFFVQIGSHDGRSGDPLFELIHRYRLRGILVEPVVYLYERCRENYRHCSGLRLVNAAIGNPRENPAFHRLKESKDACLPWWYDQLGSFRKETILKHRHLIPDIEERVVEEAVEILTFDQLLDDCGVTQVPLVHIDTEGYDYEIIKTIDFQGTGIEILLYEHKHLEARDAAACARTLEQLDYYLFPMHQDTLAVHSSVWPEI